MKLLTLNCHSWQEENQNEKIEVLAKTIKEESYDVIALQEVSQEMSQNEGENINNQDIRLKDNNYAVVLLNQLKRLGVNNYTIVWDFAHFYEKWEEGVAILTKHPVVEEHSFYVSKMVDPSNWKARKIVGATIEYEDKQLTFYSCHMGWWHDDDEPFIVQIKNLFENIPMDKHALLMGDFNNDAFIREEGYDYMIQNGLIDTYHAAKVKDDGVTVEGEIDGWEDNKTRKRIDLILSNFPVPVIYSKVVFNSKNKPVVSDHYGVEVKLAGI